jgi:hypothetical protein
LLRPLAVAFVLSFAAPVLADAGPPALPRPPSSTVAARDADSTAALGAWIDRLTGPDDALRKQAVQTLDDKAPGMVAAIRTRIADMAARGGRDAMSLALTRVRTRPDERPANFDWFERLIAGARPSDPGWRDMTALVGMMRLLSKIGTTPAVREIVGAQEKLGELVRIDVERTIKDLGERAVPALLEARKEASKPGRLWAGKMLELLKKDTPGAAVQTGDNQVLADVLLAYGRTRDMDAARVVVSFASSDRAQIREAARQAVVLMGDLLLWQLREGYENMVGKKPPDEWAWDKLASELFHAYDRARLAEIYALFDDGLSAHKAQKLEEMGQAYDKVLARAPEFERRAEMVDGYLELAELLGGKDRARSAMLLRKAARLDPYGPKAKPIESRRLTLEALDLMDRGIVDNAIVAKAVELDPRNEAALSLLHRIEQESGQRMTALRRAVVLGAGGLAAILAGIAVFLRRRRR